MTKSYDLPKTFGQPGPDTTEVVFHWSHKDGTCQECGLPAAFYDMPYGAASIKLRKLCCVCAANSAVDGETIYRIDPDTIL